MIANSASRIGKIHLVDFLVKNKIKVQKIFSPEHGLSGKIDAGKKVVENQYKTIPVLSLYGKSKKPSQLNLKDIDVLLFDLQDVGVRFYTYISTLHYVMEASIPKKIPLIVLDRPNPNIHYVDGPILEEKYKSFVGMHPVPIVYGMSIGEYAQMINGEGWAGNVGAVNLTVIPNQNYGRTCEYALPYPPSPNLKSDKAINLYPSLCLFEGTVISVGRGTATPFEIFGNPNLPEQYFKYKFTPISTEGASKPKYQNQLCYGINLNQTPRLNKLELKWLIKAYRKEDNSSSFFNSFFYKLAGTENLKKKIEQGWSVKKIRQSWTPALKKFKKMRVRYLIYK